MGRPNRNLAQFQSSLIVVFLIIGVSAAVALDDWQTDEFPESSLEEDDSTLDAYKRVYDFGVGKKSYTYEDKRLPVYNFGLGKRAPSYNFGLGKRLKNGKIIYPYGPGNPSNRYGLGLGKRPSHLYSFGLGKRSSSDLGFSDDEYENDMTVDDAKLEEEKRNKLYGFGLGKRQRLYSFGLGKRSPNNLYSFGLGKRAPVYSFGLGKKADSRLYSFGLGKRSAPYQRFNFGLGKREYDTSYEDYGDEEKRSGHRYSFGLGKREVDSSEQRFIQEEEERNNKNSNDFSADKRSRTYSFGLGKKDFVPQNGKNETSHSETKLAEASHHGNREKRGAPRYSFGLGKRDSYENAIEAMQYAEDPEFNSVEAPSTYRMDKKNQMYAFGLGRRSGGGQQIPLYGFGIGKRSTDAALEVH